MASFQGQLKTRKNGKTTTTYVESQDADGKIGKIDIQYQKEDQPPVFAKGVVSVNTIGQQESVVDRQVGSRKLGGEKTSAAVATKNAKKYAQHIRRSMDDANGYFPTNKTFVIQPLPNARFGAFDSSGQQYGSSFETYNEAAQLASALHDEAISKQTGLGVITRIEASPDSIDGEDLSVMQKWGRRIMHPLENLISFTAVNEAAGTTQVEGFDELSTVKQLIGRSQNEAQLVDGLTAAQKINRYRLSKNLPEVKSFSPAEIRTVLGNDFIEKLPDSVYFAGRDPTASQDLNYTPIDENVSVASLKKLMLQKNISSKIDSPEVDRMVKSFVGANDISEVGPGGRKLLAQRIATLPRFTKPTKLVDFTPRTYTADQLKAAISHVENNKDFTEESILESTNIDPSDNRAKIKVRDMIAEMNARGVLKDGKSPISEEIDSASAVISEEFRLPSTIGQQVSPELTIGAEEKAALLNSLKKHLDKYGLKDVGLSLEYALQRAVRDSSGNFHYGIRRKLDGDTDVETIDPDGNFVFAEEVDPVAEGYYSPRMNSIFLSIDRLTNNAATIEEAEAELIGTLDHEAIHAMRQMDLWTDKEWQGLEKAARNTVDRGAEGEDAGKTYLQMAQKRYAVDSQGNPISPVVQMEEAIAEMTRDARADLRLGGKPRSSLTRIADFFRRLISFLRGSGYQSFNDLIDRIESGEVGARARGEVRTLRAIEGQAGAVPDRGIVAAGDAAMPVVGEEEKQQVPDFFLSKARKMGMTNTDLLPTAEELAQMKDGTYVPETKRSLIEAAQFLQNRWEKATKRKKPFEYTDKNVDILSDMLADEAMVALEKDNNAIGWYDRKLKSAKSVMNLVEPRINESPENEAMFDFALAVTSNGQAVTDNFEMATEMFRFHMDNGRFPQTKDEFNKGGERNNAMLEAFNFHNAFENSGQNLSIREFLDSDFTVNQLKSIAKSFNDSVGFNAIKVPSAEGANTLVKGSYILGPKIGQGFYQNIRGNYNPLTMDIWWMRMWNRAVGRPFTARLDLQPRREEIIELVRNADGVSLDIINEVLGGADQSIRLISQDPDLTDQFVSDLDSRWQRYFKDYKAENGVNPEKPELFKKVGTFKKNLKDKLQATPAGPTERAYMRKVTEATKKRLSEAGYDITTADFQALMWYPEKQLFRALGVQPGRGSDNDYLDAAELLAAKEGVERGRVEEALRDADRDRTIDGEPSA